jgi:hypothetical protein
MKHYHLDKFIFPLLSLGLLLTQSLPAADTTGSGYKCWIDEDRVTTCGNVVPPEYVQKGFKEFNKEGIHTKDVDSAPSPEKILEMKKREEEEEKRKKQEKEDRALLDLFSTEQDIERNRLAILATIDGKIHSIDPIINSLEKNLLDLEKNLEDSLNNPEISESQREAIQKNIDDAKYRLKNNKETLQANVKEKEVENKRHDDYLQRYRDIRKRGIKPKAAEEKKADTPTAATPPTPAAGVASPQ